MDCSTQAPNEYSFLFPINLLIYFLTFSKKAPIMQPKRIGKERPLRKIMLFVGGDYGIQYFA